jgi:hypothetical protein
MAMFDYNVIKPDQSLIEIRRGHRDVIGHFVWNDQEHFYDFLGMMTINEKELVEILDSVKKLNRKSILPSWLQWGSSKR